jgi:hypothetical protein
MAKNPFFPITMVTHFLNVKRTNGGSIPSRWFPPFSWLVSLSLPETFAETHRIFILKERCTDNGWPAAITAVEKYRHDFKYHPQLHLRGPRKKTFIQTAVISFDITAYSREYFNGERNGFITWKHTNENELSTSAVIYCISLPFQWFNIWIR